MHLYTFCCAADEVTFVNGTSLEIPAIANVEVKLCVYFPSSTGDNKIILLAHRRGDPNKLLAYYLNMTRCTTPPPPGDYGVGVFTQNGDYLLKAPAAPPTISINIMSISEYYFIHYPNVLKKEILTWWLSWLALERS